ncbi:hypothetical protein SDC9_155556 [bioreactor metagenome]|uniref:Uncharacterized protein n=1 Tax=bioreactor metagenome TaxID=1076179 RepID=A0A645F6N3_9ZZZZ
MVIPWKLSIKHVRKAVEYAVFVVSLIKTELSVADGEMIAVPYSSATGMLALKAPLVAGPKIATTSSCVTNRVVTLVASDAADVLSTSTNSICLPKTPPFALTCLIANFMPFNSAWP